MHADSDSSFLSRIPSSYRAVYCGSGSACLLAGWRDLYWGGRPSNYTYWCTITMKRRDLEAALRRLGKAGQSDPETSPAFGKAMRFSGRVYREGSHWLAEVPVFEAMTQGRSRSEALRMIEDWFVTMVDRPGFSARVHPQSERVFEIDGSDLGCMISLLLRRQRSRSGLSLAEVSARLGAKSRNAYARYERGDSSPTVEKLDELLRAVSADHDLLIGQSTDR